MKPGRRPRHGFRKTPPLRRRFFHDSSLHDRHYRPGLLRLRSEILGLDFAKKARCRAGSISCRSEFALCHYRTEILRFRKLLFQSSVDLITIASKGGLGRGKRPGLSRVAKSAYPPGFVPCGPVQISGAVIATLTRSRKPAQQNAWSQSQQARPKSCGDGVQACSISLFLAARLQPAAAGNWRSCSFNRSKSTGLLMNSKAPSSLAHRLRSSP